MSYLISRAISLYRDLGIRGLIQGGINYIQYGSLREDIIGTFPRSEQLVQLYVQAGHRLLPSRYTDADPLKILWVDPEQITYDVSHTDLPRRFGRVCGGSWDLSARKFADRQTCRSLQSHFVDGVPWEDTPYYQRKYERLKAGKPTRGCSSIDDVPDYFESIDRLYDRIAENGYRTQQELYTDRPSETKEKNLDAPVTTMNEIGVSIGRDGEFYRHYRGVHRLAIAKIIGIDRVPVQILVRHSQWQDYRDLIKEEGLNPVTLPGLDIHEIHPDLNEIVNSKRST